MGKNELYEKKICFMKVKTKTIIETDVVIQFMTRSLKSKLVLISRPDLQIHFVNHYWDLAMPVNHSQQRNVY